MSLVTIKEILQDAREKHYAVPAFDVADYRMARGVLDVAEELCAPVILMGLPGDLSSESRFVRTAFTLANSVSESGAEAGICQLFHILGAAEQQNGCCELENGKFEKTIFTACFDASRGVYYYTTYENRQITAVDMYREALDGYTPIFYPMLNIQSIKIQNL